MQQVAADAPFDASKEFTPDATGDFDPSTEFTPDPQASNMTGVSPTATAVGNKTLDPAIAAQVHTSTGTNPDVAAALSTAADFYKGAEEFGGGAVMHAWNAIGAQAVGAVAGDFGITNSAEANDALAKAWRDKATWHPNSVYAAAGDKMGAVPGEFLSSATQAMTTPEGMRAVDGWARKNFGDQFTDQQENMLRAMLPQADQFMYLLQQTPAAAAVVKNALGRYAGVVGRNAQAVATLLPFAGAARAFAGAAREGLESVTAPFGGEGESEGGAIWRNPETGGTNDTAWKPSAGATPESALPESRPPTSPPPAAPTPEVPSIPAGKPHITLKPRAAAQQEPAAPAADAAAPVAPETPESAPEAAPVAPETPPGPVQSRFALPADEANRKGAPPITDPTEIDNRAAILQRALPALPEVHTSLLESNYRDTGDDVATSIGSNSKDLRTRSAALIDNSIDQMNKGVAKMSNGAKADPTASAARSQTVADAMTALVGHLRGHVQGAYDAFKRIGGNVDMTPFHTWMDANESLFSGTEAGTKLWKGVQQRAQYLGSLPGGWTPQRTESLRRFALNNAKPETVHLIRGDEENEGIATMIDDTVTKGLGEDVAADARGLRAQKGELIDRDKFIKRFAPGPDEENPEKNRGIPSVKVLDTLLSPSTTAPQVESYWNTLKHGRQILADRGDAAGAADMDRHISRAYQAFRDEVGAQAHEAGAMQNGWNQKNFVQYLQSVEDKMHRPGATPDKDTGVESRERMQKWEDLVDAGNILKYEDSYKGAVAQGVQVKSGEGANHAANAITATLGHIADANTHGVAGVLGTRQGLAAAKDYVMRADTSEKALARYNAQRVTNLANYTKRGR